MDLILWRHAEAEAEREGLADLDRALTSKGERQAQRSSKIESVRTSFFMSWASLLWWVRLR